MSDTFHFKTKAAEEAAIARYAAKAARTVRQAYAMARVDIDALAATEVYDDCRDAAYDELVVRESTHGDLVDLLLGDVTESAVALVLG
jgi:hypothetical protein